MFKIYINKCFSYLVSADEVMDCHITCGHPEIHEHIHIQGIALERGNWLKCTIWVQN